MKYICLIICLVLTLYHEYPGLCLDREEEIVEIKGIVGEFEILPNSSELSHKECMLKAREDAIKKAIGKVASTTVKVWTSVEASSTGDNFGEVAIISTDGEYADMKIQKEWMEEIEGSKVVVYKCLADIKVKKGMAPDPNFLASVHDIQDTYSDGDIMRFSLVPTKDCWMNIFLFEEDGSGYLIYPNRLDKSVMLKENTKISFPQKMNFRIVKKYSARDVEKNKLVIVLTKTPRIYAGSPELSGSDIWKWMAMIPNDEKYLSPHTFNIVKK